MSLPDVGTMKMPNGRTMTTLDGRPMLVTLSLRPSTTAPARVKAMLVAPVSETKAIPLPFAQATIVAKDGGGWTPDFRLEQN